MTSSRLLLRSVTGVLAGAALVVAAPQSVAATAPPAPLSASLVSQLAAATGLPMPIMVHGTSPAAANAAVSSTGMVTLARFDKVGVVAALATPAQVDAARTAPGVSYLEGNQPLRWFTNTSHTATRGLAARQTLKGANGVRLDGTGVSVAIVDSGIDPTHPAFTGAGGQTRVVKNLKSLCLDESSLATNCIVDLPTSVDTDTLSGGGHGTHVSGIAAGAEVTLSDGARMSGAAPGAKIVSIVAQLFQANPAATPAQIENAIKSTAYKYADGAPYSGGTSYDKGYGLVDVVAAATLLGAQSQ